MGQQPRGIRNNNPGNIRKSKDPWQGLADEQPDKEFFTFSHAKWGIRALARILITYQDKHGLDTIEKIIRRWAPPNENNTDAYIAQVCKATGWARHAALDLQCYEDLEPIVKAIIKHENGKQPYSQEVINEGLKLAGVVMGKRSLITKDRETQGAALTTVSLGATAAIDEVGKQLEPLTAYSDTIKTVFVCLTLLGILITVIARVRKQ